MKKELIAFLCVAGMMLWGATAANAIVAVSECDYSYVETVSMVNNARNVDPSAEYLMVICGQTTVPMDAKAACLRGSTVDLVLVTYTSDDASSCPTSGCP